MVTTVAVSRFALVLSWIYNARRFSVDAFVCGLRACTGSSIASKMDPGHTVRGVRFHACRVLYRDCGILQARDFKSALVEALPEGSTFFGRRFVTSSGLVCYDVAIGLSERTFATSVAALFGLLDDDAAVEVLRSPSRGESSTVFLRREVQELYNAANGGEQEELFGGLRRTLGLDERSPSPSSTPIIDMGEGAITERVSAAEDVVATARQSVRSLPYSRETLGLAVELQEERVRLAELRFVQSLMSDEERQRRSGGEGHYSYGPDLGLEEADDLLGRGSDLPVTSSVSRRGSGGDGHGVVESFDHLLLDRYRLFDEFVEGEYMDTLF